MDEETVRTPRNPHTQHQERAFKRRERWTQAGFHCPEMNREANTILSKSTDLSISDKAIALKTEIEKVRSEIQNIE
ncbi:MAG: endoribonuclease YicC domain-containing protein [Enterocloster clostridioformis]